MTLEFEQERRIFERCVQMEGARVDAYLREVLGEDRDAIESMRRLLAYHHGGVQEDGIPLPTDEDEGAIGTGERIGPYLLCECLGRGGMGVVFAATQEQPVRRRVALKLLRTELDSSAGVARFELEVQALALMDHPGIARVFDAGRTESGRPYLVMELVQGRPLTEYCNWRSLDLAQCLELFREVCLAVQHAHQKGIVHRDLKPSNVLVTSIDGTPRPKIIDFGIAKALDVSRIDATPSNEAFLGTPEYMSPEQVRAAGNVDTRTDVYSLGVLLYEILTGGSPYDRRDLREGGIDAITRIVCEVTPPRPSERLRSSDDAPRVAKLRRASMSELLRRLQSDLDWIVERAMEKEPVRRYSTTAELAQDVQRYLNGDPVSVVPQRAVYRIGKLVRRHRAAAVAFAATLLVILLATILNVRATRQTRRARAEVSRLESLAQRRMYSTSLHAAGLALANHNARVASRYLDEAPAALRRWEWFHLKSTVDRADTVARLPVLPAAMHRLPDRPGFAFAGSDSSIRFLGQQGELLDRVLEGGTLKLREMVVHNEGDLVAAVGDQGRIFTWDMASAEARPIEGHSIGLEEVAAAGDVLVSGDWGGDLIVRDFRSGQTLWSTSLGAAISSVAVSEIHAAAGLIDHTLHVFDLESGEQVLSALCAKEDTVLARPPELFAQGRVEELAFSPTGEILVAGTRDGRVSVFDLVDMLRTAHFDHGSVVHAVEFGPEGERFAVASRDRTISVWSREERRVFARLTGHDEEIRDVAFSPDGRLLASASFDSTVRLWDVVNGSALAVLRGHDGQVFGVGFSADGRHVVSFANDLEARSWDVEECLDSLGGFDGPLHWTSFIGASDVLALTTAGTLSRWSTRSREARWRSSSEVGAHIAGLDPQGRLIAVSHHGGLVRLVNAQDGETLEEWSWGQDLVSALAFAPDGRSLVVGDRAGRLTIIELESGQARSLRTGGPIRDAEFLDSSRVFVLRDDSLELVSLSGAVEQALGGEFEATAACLAVHPTGDRVAIGFMDGSVHLRRSSDGETLHELNGHISHVTAVAWFPDGSRLLSGAADASLRVWDPRHGDAVGVLRGHTYRDVRTIDVSSDGTTVVSGGYDRVVRFWSSR